MSVCYERAAANCSCRLSSRVNVFKLEDAMKWPPSARRPLLNVHGAVMAVDHDDPRLIDV